MRIWTRRSGRQVRRVGQASASLALDRGVAPTVLCMEACSPNRDIGFVHPGESAEIKIDTFNFTRYGLLHGTVLGVSQDAISHDKPQDKSRANPQPNADSDTSSEPKGQELVYAARVSLDRAQM